MQIHLSPTAHTYNKGVERSMTKEKTRNLSDDPDVETTIVPFP